MVPLPEWVLDTNVIVSGLLSPTSPPGRLIDAILARRLAIVVDDRIVHEYRDVLGRPKFRFSKERLRAFFGVFPFQSHVSAPAVAGIAASDPDDTVFLEVAVASPQRTLVTGNVRHFPKKGRGGVRVVSPGEAVELLFG